MRFILYLILALHLSGCGCGSDSGEFGLRIGVDPTWYPLNFGPQQPYVNGFADDFMMEVARYDHIEFERVGANWDALLEGLSQKKYAAVLTSLPPYAFNEAKYDFSAPILALGPVLVAPAGSKEKDLGKMKGRVIGFIGGDAAEGVLQKYPQVMMRPFPSIPELLDAVAREEIDAALLNRIPAVNYVNDLYPGVLKIASAPLTDAGIRLVALKGKHEGLIKSFDKSLRYFQKKKKLDKLLKKWNLSGQ